MDDHTLNSSVSAPRHWRSLDERTETPAAQAAAHNEFADGITAPLKVPAKGLSRRRFLGLVGATAALAASTACGKKNRHKVVAYTKRPIEVVPGVANHYASAFQEGLRVYPVLVKTREGRPIHLTGNDEHPGVRGKTSPRAMAETLSLYDPDRLRAPLARTKPAGWDEALNRLGQGLVEAKTAGKATLLITSATLSPSRQALLAEFKAALPTLTVLAWEPGVGTAAQEAALALYGQPVQIRPRLESAKAILALGADFLSGEDPEAARTFAEHRKLQDPHGPMNRLWVAEGSMSLTGTNADQRLVVRPSSLAALGFAVAKGLQALGHRVPAGVNLPAVSLPGLDQALVARLVKDLHQAGKHGLVLCGDAMPAEAHVAAALLNAMLESEGTTLETLPAPKLATAKELDEALAAMGRGDVGAVLFWGSNPVHTFPKGNTWKEALAKVPVSAWIGLVADETAALCGFALPEHHWLEAWGDHATPTGHRVLQQPTVGALHDSRQGEDILLGLLKSLGATPAADYHTYLKGRWSKDVYPTGSLVPFERFFESALHDGFVADRTTKAVPALNATSVQAALAVANKPTVPGMELLLLRDLSVFDGRHANNGWLQELPDPVTKATWGNPLALSVADAKELGLKEGDVVRLEQGGTTLTTPVLIQPGQAKGVLSMALGYGRTAGSVATGIGVNAYSMWAAESNHPNLRLGVQVIKTGATKALPLTQTHHRMEGRDLVRSWSLAEYGHQVEHPHHGHELHTLNPEMTFPDHKWGMVIDLSACIGCSGCVVACQSENNIPVVGPEQVLKGREMHWIRVDRYFEGDPEYPSVVHQPMMCQQCDHAPCENVCPVNATNHSPDGLNQMAYNRCVGTRYCANNCPYKVRRYNFFEHANHKTEHELLAYNPEVTVRPRGVMEKCTFCVQRIQDGRMRALAEGRPVQDGDITPACAAACPTQAIVFGDLKDPKSRVSQLAKANRQYKVLEELGARPAVTYLADLKNPATDQSGHGEHA